uniref:Protein LEG1 homolog n=1 Tax=Pogona vitticeps TaxID=103695 RepID=A0ABM5GEX2_9SAUR
MGYIFHLAVCLLTSSALSLLHEEKQTQEPEGFHDAFPPLWESAPRTLEDYLRKGNTIVINPWNYRERLGLYKILLNFSAKYFAGLGPKNGGNILWGLPLQHGWQYRTGRLADPISDTVCGHKDGDDLCVSVYSWWACMNYYLAVIPFLGALDSGFFGELPYEVEMLPPVEQQADFCHSTTECKIQAPRVMASWSNFFKYLLSTEPNSESSATLFFSQEEALNYMWKAHVQSIAFALPKFQNRLSYLNSPESAFAKDWSAAVDFIAATHFSTNQNTTNQFQTGLPPRLLLEGDKEPLIADFTPTQNKVLFLLRALRKSNEKMGGILLLLWRKAMSSEEARKIARHLLESII